MRLITSLIVDECKQRGLELGFFTPRMMLLSVNRATSSCALQGVRNGGPKTKVVQSAPPCRCMDGRAQTRIPNREPRQRLRVPERGLGKGWLGADQRACLACGRKNRAVSEVTRGEHGSLGPLGVSKLNLFRAIWGAR